MNRLRHKLILIIGTIGLCCLSTGVMAQYPFYGPTYNSWYPNYGPAYNRWSPNYYAPYRGYGYLHPKWQVRGYVNRYGDYQFDVKLRNISKQDMYRAWLMYRAYGGQR